MFYEIVVEGFVLDVEVTHCVNSPPRPDTWDSDWDAQGTRELEFRIDRAVEYDNDGNRMPADKHLIHQQHWAQIETALWFEIDSRALRHRRLA